MAQGDSKLVKTHYRSVGRAVSYRPVSWDKENRADSQRWYDRVKDDPYGSLKGMQGSYQLRDAIAAMQKIAVDGKTNWSRVVDAIGTDKAQELIDIVKEDETARQEAWKRECKEREDARRVQLEEQTNTFRKDSELTSGMLSSDFHQAIVYKEVYNRPEGDWLEDPVAGYTEGTGFAEEVRERAGIRLQITLSLDISTSMWNNSIANDAIRAYMTLGLALEAMKQEFPNSLFCGYFVFAGQQSGKYAHMLRPYGYSETPEDLRLGQFDHLRSWLEYQPSDAGYDTFIAPLFTAIEDWETENSDPGCVRLDLVITDGILEHKSDVQEASVIQTRRDGALQTILLNFLDDEEWKKTQLPLRCVQYPVSKDNLSGLLRQLLGEFVSVYA